ncbi:acyltransferase [Leptospira levettii]|uniref:nitrilase-related carbon-nitrogen hydrolase n=1 Tax=Leptospira levettii TaxID=2023178 RepID=UPI001083F355|nr:nitrilase-related carbon-nitrogen hydrolase [Leptospira levettii]TGM70777.1 acyltransferase [Leptospira levettii]
MNLLSNQWFLLLVSGIFLGFTGMNWNISIFAWFAFVPLLRYVRLGFSFKLLFLSLILIQIFSTMRIVSEPFHVWIAIISGIQAGIVFSLLLWIWNLIRKQYGMIVSHILFFSFTCTILEWIGAYHSDLGVWGMLANSQLGNLVLLQSASLFGATGVSFVLYLFNGTFEQMLSELFDQKQISRSTRLYISFTLIFVVSLYFYGTFRLSLPITGKQIKVATITTKMDIQSLWKNPVENNKNTELTIEKTKIAAKEGAKIVVWNEGAVLVSKEKESDLLNSLVSMAKEEKIELVAAYIIQIKDNEFFFDNKLVWLSNQGQLRQTYHKQFIVPFEPVSKIHSEIQSIETEFGKMSVAICYDFDSLKVSDVHSESGSGITLIPASDWKGINPFHTEMATIRGIENGSSIVRSARSGLSGIFDAYGRAKGTLDYFEENDGILVSSVSTSKINTLYSQFGNWIVGIGLFHFVFSGFQILRIVRKNRIRAQN